MKKSFILVLGLLILLIIILLFTRRGITDNNKLNSDIDELTNTTIDDKENINDNDEDYSNDDYVFYNGVDSVGDNANILEQLDNFNFNIEISNEVLNYIKDIENFKINIKKYIYLNGLVDATVAKLKEYELNENGDKLKLIFSLNNEAEDYLLVIIDQNGDIIDIWNY